MRNIYGNRSIIPNNYYFTFDRIYPNEDTVKTNTSDGVFIGRTVLAEEESTVWLKTVKGYIKVAKLDNTGRFSYLEGKYLNQENSFNNIDNLKSGGTTPHGNGTYLIEYNENGKWPNPNGFSLQKGDLFLLYQYTVEESENKLSVCQILTDLHTERKEPIKESEKYIEHNNKTFIRNGIITYTKVDNSEGTYSKENETSNFFENAVGDYTRTIEWKNWNDTSERYIGYLGDLSSTNNINEVATVVEALSNLDALIGQGKLLTKEEETPGINATNIINTLIEHDNEIGALYNLTQDTNNINKPNLVEAINQLNKIIGLLSQIKNQEYNLTNVKTFADAIIKLNSLIGNENVILQDNDIKNKTIVDVLQEHDDEIGELKNLKTTIKSNLIAAINELVSENNKNQTDLEKINNYLGNEESIVISRENETITYETLNEFIQTEVIPVVISVTKQNEMVNKLSENMDILDTTLAFYINQQEKENGIDTYMNWGTV